MRRLILAISAVLLMLAVAVPAQVALGASYFPETGHSLEGPFLDYWNAHGGLGQFGYPITDEVVENGRTTQYLERAVFEYWPENPDPYKVQLRLLGNILTSGRAAEAPFQRVEAASSSDHLWYFPETGHTLSWGFLSYWQSHGGLDLYGYPISEEFSEVSPTDGKTYTVQYFQRNRFEYHPENKGTPYETLLGLLGSEYYHSQSAPQPAPEPAPQPSPAPVSQPQQFSGHGRQATAQFHLDKGIAQFNTSYHGQYNFIVELLDDQGKYVDLVANAIGDSSSSKLIGVPQSGSYIMNVTADGDWTITVEEVQPASDLYPPQPFTGHGNQSTVFFNLKAGLATFTTHYSGESNFIAVLKDSDGEWAGLVANQIGSGDGSYAAGIDTAGLYYLDVTATGDWTIQVQQ